MDDAKLIQLVRDNEFLYNKNDPKYKIRNLKVSTWHYIANEVGTSYEYCLRRWITLRDRYTKECRRMRSYKEKGEELKPFWHHFESMEFLKDHIITKAIRYGENMANKIDQCLLADMSESKSPSSTSWSADEFLLQCHNLPLADADDTGEEQIEVKCYPYGEEFELQQKDSQETSGRIASPAASTSSTLSQKRKKSTDDEDKYKYKPNNFKRKRDVENDIDKNNEALDGFMQMIYATMVSMDDAKKIRTMQKVTEIVMSIKLESDN